MRAFIYAAALHCEPCGEAIRELLAESAPADVGNESTYDSDDFPKGPYADGGGEADTPQHCDSCGVFLRNSLTGEGERYVCEALAPARARAIGRLADWRRDSFADFLAASIEGEADPLNREAHPVLAEWAREYSYLVEEPAEQAA